MAENEESRSHEAFMEVMEPSDMNLLLLCETENLPDDVILISPLTPPLASHPAQEQHQLWMDSECGVSSNTGENVQLQECIDEPFSVKPCDSMREMDPLFGSKLIPTELMQRSKVKTHKCTECSKVFKTTYALNKHLLTHQLERSHICNICQKVFKHRNHLTGHMLTHQKRKDYRCSYPGCQKMYCGYRSLQRHCATQHGTYLLPPSSQPSALNTQACPPLWEPPKLPTVKGGASTSADCHSYFPPLNPNSIIHLKGKTGCGASCSNYTMTTNLNLSHNPEDPNLSQVKLPVIAHSWSLVTDGASCSLESAVGLSPSPSMVMSNQWAPTVGLVDPEEPETVHTWERNLDILVPDLQKWKDAPSSSEMGSRVSSACPRRHQPNLLKLSMRQHEPQNKQQGLFYREASCSTSNISGTSAPRMEPVIPPFRPTSKSKTKKKRVKRKILTDSTVPTPPLPSSRPTTQRRPRLRPASLISPSQVAMASFSKECTPSDTFKSIAQGGNATAVTQNGRDSAERTYLKYPPCRHAQISPSRSQASTTSYKRYPLLVDSTVSSTKGGRVDMVGDCCQADQEVQLSPLVIPVSIPVSSKEAPFNKASGNTIEKLQNVKSPSKTFRPPGLLRSLITPNLAARGYLSHLRSPTYLTDHLLNLDPPPYTPPPMLSPLRRGTGLYFNTLPQYQPCLPPPSIYSASLDGSDGISLTSDNTVISIEPKINVGSRFQAEIPPLRSPLLILYDEHPAQLVWAPWGDLPTNPETQQKVTEFLNMCCSSVLPGGGTNSELALHCLHEVQGDVLAALDLLLVRGDFRTSSHALSDYRYTGSDHWTAQEMRRFQKALLSQTKDFQLIHKALQTKSVAQCVEYYYTMKKLKKFKNRCRGIEHMDGAGKNAESHSATNKQYDEKLEKGNLLTYQRPFC